jgi:ribulose-phosphate 3-epimerase
MKTFPAPSQPILAPSILAGDHANLQSSLAVIENSGARWVHLDIMDGHFVPNLTFGPQTVADLRPLSSLFFDVHLMLSRPDRYVEAFVDAGADLISIHVEPDYDIASTLSAIRDSGIRAGIVLNPDTPFEKALPFLNSVDLVLQMTVFPGFGGQKFIESTLVNIQSLADHRNVQGLSYRIEVDGGIDLNTVGFAKRAGADTFVSGSAFFKQENPSVYSKQMLSV